MMMTNGIECQCLCAVYEGGRMKNLLHMDDVRAGAAHRQYRNHLRLIVESFAIFDMHSLQSHTNPHVVINAFRLALYVPPAT